LAARSTAARWRRDRHAAILAGPRGPAFLLWSSDVFVIELIYKTDLEEIDAHMRSHMAFLKKHYAAGNFVVSGRKIPRDGGIILAVGNDKKQIEAIVEQDPFVKHKLADFRIIEFRASQRADNVAERIEADRRAHAR
jgi:uncharacterized protein YciI